MSPRNDEERELQELLRASAAVVLIVLFALVVVVTLIGPFLSDRAPDTTLLLGLSSSALGAALALMGVQVAISRRKIDDDDDSP